MLQLFSESRGSRREWLRAGGLSLLGLTAAQLELLRQQPANAAATLKRMDRVLATRVLMSMNPRDAGKVMDKLDSKTAARLGAMFTQRRLGKK